jgi:hypothetical protein
MVLLLAMAMLSSTAQAQRADSFKDNLPDAPQAQQTQTQQTTPAPQDAAADPKAASGLNHQSYEKRKWSGYVDPRERVPTLRAKDKMVFWLHEEVEPASPLPALISAGYGQLTVGNPKYGSDAPAFGERLGAALLRDASMRFFSDSLIPTLDHEDPRYFRLASGSYMARGLHAAEFTFVDRNDAGRRVVNVSDLAGHLAASALTRTYYPQPSANSRVVMETWGTSIAGAAVNNIFLEFWPDVVNWMHHRKR